MLLLLQVAVITDIDLVLGEAYTVEWSLITSDEEKIDCYPDEQGVSAENCVARGCVWEVTRLVVFICLKNHFHFSAPTYILIKLPKIYRKIFQEKLVWL